MIIVVEGLDRCGKTTLINKFKNEYQVDIIRYPDYNGIFGKEIKDHLYGINPVEDETLDKYFFYNILAGFNTLNKYRYNHKKHLIIDRWLYSTIAYRNGVNSQHIYEAISTLSPDLVIYIDKPPLFDVDNRLSKEQIYDDNYEIQQKARKRYKDIFYAREPSSNKLKTINHVIMQYRYEEIDRMYNTFKKIILQNIYKNAIS